MGHTMTSQTGLDQCRKTQTSRPFLWREGRQRSCENYGTGPKSQYFNTYSESLDLASRRPECLLKRDREKHSRNCLEFEEFAILAKSYLITHGPIAE